MVDVEALNFNIHTFGIRRLSRLPAVFPTRREVLVSGAQEGVSHWNVVRIRVGPDTWGAGRLERDCCLCQQVVDVALSTMFGYHTDVANDRPAVILRGHHKTDERRVRRVGQ